MTRLADRIMLFFYSFEDAYEFNHGKEEKEKVVDSCYKKRI